MSGKRQVLSRHAIDLYTFSLSPDNKEFAYIAQPREGEANEVVRVADVRSPRERLLADNAAFLGVSWAPNGQQLALAGYGPNHGLWLVNPDGSGLRKVREWPGPLAWSSDSKFLAGGCPISVLSLETGEERVLAEGFDPRWSPDGTRIAFVHALYCVDTDVIEVFSLRTGELRDLTRGSFPVWSPGGRRIALVGLSDLPPLDSSLRSSGRRTASRSRSVAGCCSS